jgi:membrane-associated phospholipid phosphatase
VRTLTNFGDIAVLIPLSTVILVWVLIYHSRRVAESWAMAVGLCIGTTALLKIYLYACPPRPDLVSPSGHTSLSVLIYGTIALVTAAEQRGWLRAAIPVACGGLILTIVGSRLWLNAHSALEVGVGIIIGVMTLAFFANFYRRSPPAGISLRAFIVSVIVVIAILHGQELHAEALLQAISRSWHLTSFACVG